MVKVSGEMELLLKRDSHDGTRSQDNFCTAVPPSLDSHISEQTKVYRRRWYILLVFSIMTFVADSYANTISPIQGPVKLLFHWEDWNILLFNALGMFSLLSATPLFAWLVVSKGR